MADDELAPDETAFLDGEIAHASAILDAENAARDARLHAEVFGPDPALQTFLGDAQPKAIEDWGDEPREGEAEFGKVPDSPGGFAPLQDRLDEHAFRLVLLEDPDPEPELLTEVRWQIFAVLVWRDGGTTDGDKTHQCDRTYAAKTLDSAKTHGTELTPDKTRPNVGRMNVPSTTGDGVVGLGYCNASGAFCLYDANECIYAEACP